MASHEMFNYLMEGSSSKTSNLDTLKEYARGAAYSFLGNDSTPLNHSIEKTAQVNALSPDEVSIVCQEANKEVYSQLFKNSDDKYVEFDIADPQAVISSLGGGEKVASTQDPSYSAFAPFMEKEASSNTGLSDFDLEPGEVKSLKGDQFADGYQTTKQAGDSNLYFKPEQKTQAEIMRKLAKANNLKQDISVLDSQIESQLKHCVKIARNELMKEPLEKRASKFPYVAVFCKQAGMNPDQIDTLLNLTKEVMVKQHLLEKTADVKADPELISENLDARVINGTHPLELHIKTIVDACQKREGARNDLNLIKTQLAEACHDERVDGAILAKKVREL